MDDTGADGARYISEAGFDDRKSGIPYSKLLLIPYLDPAGSGEMTQEEKAQVRRMNSGGAETRKRLASFENEDQGGSFGGGDAASKKKARKMLPPGLGLRAPSMPVRKNKSKIILPKTAGQRMGVVKNGGRWIVDMISVKEPEESEWGRQLGSVEVRNVIGKFESTVELYVNEEEEKEDPLSFEDGSLQCTRGALVTQQVRSFSGTMKSTLQKLVRLRRPTSAVRVALELLRSDPAAFLRRLPVIILEDAVLHPGLSLVVYAMASYSKSQPLTKTLVSALLSIVADAASCRVKDKTPPTSVELKDGPISFQTVDETFPDSPTVRAMLKSILLRVGFGGTTWDMKFLSQYALLWFLRFRNDLLDPEDRREDLNPPEDSLDPNGYSPNPMPGFPLPGGWSEQAGQFGVMSVSPVEWEKHTWIQWLGRRAYGGCGRMGAIDVSSVGPVGPADIVLSGLDQHPLPQMPQYVLSQRGGEVRENLRNALRRMPRGQLAIDAQSMGDTDLGELLAKMMWEFRSSVTKAEVVGGEGVLDPGSVLVRNALLPVWEDVASDVDSYSAHYVNTRMLNRVGVDGEIEESR